MSMIDKSSFSIVEKPTEYRARFKVEGEIRMTIEASSIDDARAKAAAMLSQGTFGEELDSVDNVAIDNVWKTAPMYRVLRDGKAYQVSHLNDGDVPREPGERGF